MRCVVFALGLAACWNSTPPPVVPPAPAPPAVETLRVRGDWTPIALSPDYTLFGGLVTSERGPLIYVGTGGSAHLIALTGTSPPWQAPIEGVIGSIASTGGRRLLTTYAEDDGTPPTSEVLWERIFAIGPSGHEEQVQRACRGHTAAFDGTQPLVVASCLDRVAVYARGPKGWAERGSVAGLGLPVAAVMSEGRLHVFDREDMTLRETGFGTERYEVRHWSLDADGTVKLYPLRDNRRIFGVAACNGRIFATFADDDHVYFGRWHAGRWSFEKVTDSGAAGSVLTLDESCRPFIGQDTAVHWRGPKRWHSATVESASTILGITVHAGRLYVAYHISHNRMGAASSPLVR